MSALSPADVDDALADGPTQTEYGNPSLIGLTEREREVYVSCDLEGLRPADVAPVLDVSPSTVRTLLSRARQKRGESR